MAWKAAWDLGDVDPRVGQITGLLNRKYTWAREMGVVKTNTYTQAVKDAVKVFQRKVGLPPTGSSDWATQNRLGVFGPTAPVYHPTITVYTVPGTWAGWNDGPPAWVAWGLDKNRFIQQGVGYPATGFMMGDPNTSYNESVVFGVEETVRLILLDPKKIVLVGYSQGAEVVIRVLKEFQAGGRLAHRRGDLLRVITFGSPSRPAGPTRTGVNPPGDGISGFFTPAEFRSITFDYVNNGDMYACSTKLLKSIYGVLTKMELSMDFALVVLQLLATAASPLIGVLLGPIMGGAAAGGLKAVLDLVAPKATEGDMLTLQGLLENIPDVIATIQVALQFVTSNAHFNYHTWPDFQGKNAVQHAIDGLHTSGF